MVLSHHFASVGEAVVWMVWMNSGLVCKVLEGGIQQTNKPKKQNKTKKQDYQHYALNVL